MPENISKRQLYLTNREELMAYLGILYLLGVKKMNKANLEEAWARNGTGIEILQGVMSLRRFRNLTIFLRFDDTSTRADRKKTDKLGAIH